jgi:hypothetical protein
MEQTIVDEFISWLKESRRSTVDILKKLCLISKDNNISIAHLNSAYVLSSPNRREISNYHTAVFKEYPKKSDEGFIEKIRKFGLSGKSFIYVTSDFWGYKSIDFYSGTKNLGSIIFKSEEQKNFNKLVDLYHSL